MNQTDFIEIKAFVPAGDFPTPIKTQPYFMRDFTVSDPSGVGWIIGENIPGGLHV